MRVKAQIKIIISEDDDQLQELGPDFDIVIDDNIATLTKHKASILNLAGGSAEVAYAFAPELTNGKYLLVRVLSGAIKVKLNGAATPFGLTVNPAVALDPILPYQSQPQSGVIAMGPMTLATPLTSLAIQNESGTVAARVAVAIVGEAV